MRTALGNTTRLRLVEAATRSFAEDTVERASLLDIARRAGQRNRGAVHYHFGSRRGLLVAVLDQYAATLGERRTELLGSADDDTLTSVVDAVVRPVVELAETGWRGRCYIVVVSQVSLGDPASWEPEIAAVISRTGGREVYERLLPMMPAMPDDLRSERLWLIAAFVLGAVADRARDAERPGARPHPEVSRFLDNLTAMVVGMVTAETPEARTPASTASSTS